MTLRARGAKSGGFGPAGPGAGMVGPAWARSASSPASAIMPQPVEHRLSICRRVRDARAPRARTGCGLRRSADIEEFLEVQQGMGQVLRTSDRIRRPIDGPPGRTQLDVEGGDLPRQSLALRTLRGGQAREDVRLGDD